MAITEGCNHETTVFKLCYMRRVNLPKNGASNEKYYHFDKFTVASRSDFTVQENLAEPLVARETSCSQGASMATPIDR